MAFLGVYLLVLLLVVLVFVSISRWVFRINDIVNRLDIIIHALKAEHRIEEIKK